MRLARFGILVLLSLGWSAAARGDERPYLEVRTEIEAGRVELRARQAAGEDVSAAAATTLTRALVDEILPRWIGVPWARGKASLARSPEEPAAGVNCASFLIAAMEGAGFRFAHRGQLVRAPALRILEAVAPEGGDAGDESESEGAAAGAILRWRGSIPELERELLRRGPGVYLLGLAQHIGFAVVPSVAGAAASAPRVRLVHASRGTGAVVDEPMVTARALLSSRGAPIFAVRLIQPPSVRRWLAGAALGPA